MPLTIQDAHDQAMRALNGVFLPEGTAFKVSVRTAQLLNEGQQFALELFADAKVNIVGVEQTLLRISSNATERLPRMPELGDAEITIAGVPRVGGSAAEAVASVLKALATVGIAAAVVKFTTDPQVIGDATSKTAREVGDAIGSTAITAGIPLLLILLVLLFLLKEWNK